MNRSINCVIVASAVLLTTQAALAQMAGMTPPPPSTGPASEALAAYNRVKPNVLKAADKMPEDGYQFKPTPDIRAYARIVNHVTEAQFRTCSALSGDKMDPKSVPSDTADKATIVAALKASFAECDKAYAGLTDATIAEMLQLGPAKRSRIGLAWGNISHDNEQYAELATYLRLKGLVPPSSEK